MNNYLLVYDRRSGALTVEEFAGPSGRAPALKARLQMERQPGHEDTEVVVIAADSQDDLKRTHARYFGSVATLARSAGGRLALA